jgi:hypothetical protein
MRYLALLVPFFIMCVGVTGIFMPDILMAVGRYVVTPNGLYAVAALRVGIGLVLMFVARISRAPRTLRTLGAVVLVGGLATPFFGVDRARAVLDWEATQGTMLIRIGTLLAVLPGASLRLLLQPIAALSNNPCSGRTTCAERRVEGFVNAARV